MVTLERLKGQLLLGLDLLFTHLVDLIGEDNLGLGRTVNTVGLDGDDHTSLVLQEEVGVVTDDTGLIGLGNIGEDDIHHGHKHTVAERKSGVINDAVGWKLASHKIVHKSGFGRGSYGTTLVR